MICLPELQAEIQFEFSTPDGSPRIFLLTSSLTIALVACKIRGTSQGEELMRLWLRTACALLIAPVAAFGQQPAAKGKVNAGKQFESASAQPNLKDLLESKIQIEWTAFKNKDPKAYGDLLADDFVAVETDSEGERNKLHAVGEVSKGLVNDFLLARFKVLPLGTDAAFVIYECSIKFYPKATVRFLRVYVSELWVKRDGQWKALHYQETRVK